MKIKLLVLVGTLLLQAQSSFADDNACQKQYGQSVSYCAQSLSSLPTNIRAGAQKACVQDAKLTKDACLTGPDPVCLSNCTTNFNAGVLVCTTNFNFAVCNGNLDCEVQISLLRSDCITQSVNALNSCNAACGLVP